MLVGIIFTRIRWFLFILDQGLTFFLQFSTFSWANSPFPTTASVFDKFDLKTFTQTRLIFTKYVNIWTFDLQSTYINIWFAKYVNIWMWCVKFWSSDSSFRPVIPHFATPPLNPHRLRTTDLDESLCFVLTMLKSSFSQNLTHSKCKSYVDLHESKRNLKVLIGTVEKTSNILTNFLIHI